MSTQEELFRTISADEVLMDELMQAWEKGAGAQEIADLLASKGIEAPLDQVEALLARAQKANADRIETEELDIDELNRMAGGGDGKCAGTANCDEDFQKRPDAVERCTWQSLCDEYYASIHCTSNLHICERNHWDGYRLG